MVERYLRLLCNVAVIEHGDACRTYIARDGGIGNGERAAAHLVGVGAGHEPLAIASAVGNIYMLVLFFASENNHSTALAHLSHEVVGVDTVVGFAGADVVHVVHLCHLRCGEVGRTLFSKLDAVLLGGSRT